MLTIRKARPDDAEDLAIASREAFHSDIDCGASGLGGPPGYDSAAWQRRVMKVGDYYTLLCEGQIVGGVIVFRQGPGHYELGRIFVHPDWQNRGIGKEAFAFLWRTYPLVTRWTLGTPVWNVRTRHFYPTVGFQEIGIEGDDDVRFERRISPRSPGAPHAASSTDEQGEE